MNKGLANILKDKLSGLPFIEKAAGLVYVAEYEETTYDETGQVPTTYIKKIPVSCDVDPADCDESYLVPDSGKRGILYFENGLINVLGFEGAYLKFRSHIRLVMWINTNWIQNVDCLTTSGIMMAHTIGLLTSIKLLNVAPYLGIGVMINSIPLQNKAIFSPYTYDLYNTQYILPPFEYFALDLAIDFKMHPGCIADLQIKTPDEFMSDKNCS